MPLSPGQVVKDPYGTVAITLRPSRTPTAGWIRAQRDPRIRDLPKDAIWWTALPLRGGSCLIAAPLAEVLRAATYEDFDAAAAHGNPHARRELAQLFPEFEARRSQERREG